MIPVDVLPVLEEPWALDEAQAVVAYGLAQAGYTRAAIAAILNTSVATVGRRLAQARPGPHVPRPLGFLGPTPEFDGAGEPIVAHGGGWCPDCRDNPAHRVYCLTCNSYGGFDSILKGERIAAEGKERAQAEAEAAEQEAKRAAAKAERDAKRRKRAAKRGCPLDVP